MGTAKKALFPVFFVIFMDNFGFSILFNLLPTVFLNSHYSLVAASTSTAMRNVLLAITFGVFPLTQFFGSPMIGDFADHFGRKKALYITILTVTAGYVLSAMAISINSLTLLIGSRLLTGFFAGNLSICLAAIADLSPDEKSRARNFSHVTTLFGFSWILAMILSGYISNPKYLGYHGPVIVFLITAGVSFLSFIAVWWWFDETYKVDHEVKFDLLHGVKNVVEALCLKHVRTMFVTYFFWVIGWGATVQWFPAYSLEVFSASMVGVTTWMIILGITWTFSSSILNNLMLKKMHSLSIALMGAVGSMILVGASIFVTNYEVFGILLSLGAATSAFTMCNTMNLISLAAPKNIQGKVMGLSQSMMSLGWIISAGVAALLNKYSIALIYWFTTACLVVTLIFLLFVFLMRKAKGYSEAPGEETIFVDHQKD